MTGLSVADLRGLWFRSLISWPDGRRDETTFVAWLQGPNLYADLRQPAGRPDFSGIECLRDLAPRHLAWLARQEGFAGILERRSEHFIWQRMIDFQPAGPLPDAARLRFDGGILIEEGQHLPYVEHWHRRRRSAEDRRTALRLGAPDDGREAILLRDGDWFLFARDRAHCLPDGRSLAECLAAAGDLRKAQDMVDCEISLGRVGEGIWTISRSTLPFREGRSLGFATTGKGVTTAEPDARGRPTTRRWNVVSAEGIWPSRL